MDPILVQAPLQINKNLVTSTDSNYAYMVNQQPFQVYFKRNSRTSRSVRLQSLGYQLDIDNSTSQLRWFSTSLNAIVPMQSEMTPRNTTATVSNDIITFTNAWINADLMYQIANDGIKESIKIKAVSPPTNASADILQFVSNCYFTNTLAVVADGISYLHPINAKFTTQGSIEFKDTNGKLIFFLPPPIIYDNTPNIQQKWIVGTYAVTANDGSLVINIKIPKSFVDSATFPIYFDPPAYVAGTYSHGTWSSGTTFTTTLAVTPTNGNVLIACIGITKYTTPALTVVSVASTGGGVTWTSQATRTGSATYTRSEIWYGTIDQAGTSQTITTTISANTPIAATCDICEFSNMAMSSFLDKTTGADGYANLATISGTTDPTTQASELWVASIITRYPSTTQGSPTHSFIQVEGDIATFLSFCYYIASATATAHVDTTVNTADYYCGVIATFKAAAAPSAPTIKKGGFWSLGIANNMRDRIIVGKNLKRK